MELLEFDTTTASDELLDKLYDYYVPLYEEELPGDPPTPKERRLRDWKAIPRDEAVPRWLLLEGDDIVASALAHYNLEQDLDNGFLRINVRMDRRGEGLARKLVPTVLDHLEDAGRKRIHTYVPEGSTLEPYLEGLGLKSAYREKRSRLVVADVDMGMMQEWIDRAPERASEYELISMRMPYPDDLLDKWCELQLQMNTAPMEDFEMEDWKWTPELWRGLEETIVGNEKDSYTTVAAHRETGEWVGSSSIQTDRLDVAQAWQWETVVHPDHRNKGLGRWLKAETLMRTVEAVPEVARIDTWNAGSNEPMLNINVAMGFKAIMITNAYQGETAEFRKRLGV